MLILRKIEVTEDKITYSYDPERSGKLGVLAFYPKRKNPEEQCVVEKLSAEETDIFDWYRGHAFTKMQDMWEQGTFPDEVRVIWY